MKYVIWKKFLDLLQNMKIAHDTLTDKREDLILPYIKGKAVLDLGVGDTIGRFLHKFIRENSNESLGIEISKIRAERLKKMGYKVVIGDAQNFKLGRTFDAVVAGDLIEHLTNFDGFFQSATKHLKKGGYFIINTPNMYSINSVLRGLFGNTADFEEHTCGFDEALLRQLVARYPQYEIEKVVYFTHLAKGVRNIGIRFLCRFNKRYNENILIILKRVA